MQTLHPERAWVPWHTKHNALIKANSEEHVLLEAFARAVAA